MIARIKDSNPAQGCSSLVFVVCCVGGSLCHEPFARSEGSYRLCVIYKPQQRGGLDRSWVLAPQTRNVNIKRGVAREGASAVAPSRVDGAPK